MKKVAAVLIVLALTLTALAEPTEVPPQPASIQLARPCPSC